MASRRAASAAGHGACGSRLTISSDAVAMVICCLVVGVSPRYRSFYAEPGERAPSLPGGERAESASADRGGDRAPSDRTSATETRWRRLPTRLGLRPSPPSPAGRESRLSGTPSGRGRARRAGPGERAPSLPGGQGRVGVSRPGVGSGRHRTEQARPRPAGAGSPPGSAFGRVRPPLRGGRTASAALLLDAVERVAEALEGVFVGGVVVARRDALHGELVRPLHGVDDLALLGRVLDPEVLALGDEVELILADHGLMLGRFLEVEVHDQADLVPDLLGRPGRHKHVAFQVLEGRGEARFRLGERVADLAPPGRHVDPPVAVGFDERRLPAARRRGALGSGGALGRGLALGGRLSLGFRLTGLGLLARRGAGLRLLGGGLGHREAEEDKGRQAQAGRDAANHDANHRELGFRPPAWSRNLNRGLTIRAELRCGRRRFRASAGPPGRLFPSPRARARRAETTEAPLRAVLCKAFGGPETLALEDIPEPKPGPDQVLVRVSVAALNFLDTLIIEGKYQLKPELPFSPGAELSGTIAAIGSNVAGWRVGERVAAFPGWGACRELALVKPNRMARLPDGVPDEQAAGLTVTYGTSLHALKDRARMQPGETLAVLGAAGGAGLSAVEIGNLMGARVIACASSDDKLALAREHGADLTLNYTAENLREGLKRLTDGRGVDVLYDPVGGDLAEPGLRSMAWQ